VLLLIAFIAWSQSIEWLFFLVIGALMIASKNLVFAVFIAVVIGSLWIIQLQQYYFLGLIIIAIVILGVAIIQHKQGGGKEYVSPELMRLLGGAE
jgi:peptidoglycan/LPS O-acetylase OafA/YrhL